eukprot:scaffold10566_cov173-Isochrysis_galbana.AAC.3
MASPHRLRSGANTAPTVASQVVVSASCCPRRAGTCTTRWEEIPRGHAPRPSLPLPARVRPPAALLSRPPAPAWPRTRLGWSRWTCGWTRRPHPCRAPPAPAPPPAAPRTQPPAPKRQAAPPRPTRGARTTTGFETGSKKSPPRACRRRAGRRAAAPGAPCAARRPSCAPAPAPRRPRPPSQRPHSKRSTAAPEPRRRRCRRAPTGREASSGSTRWSG